jgi:hypothetical protein
LLPKMMLPGEPTRNGFMKKFMYASIGKWKIYLESLGNAHEYSKKKERLVGLKNRLEVDNLR